MLARQHENLYTDHILHECKSPYHKGRLERPSCTRCERNPVCGDWVRLELEIAGGRVAQAYFDARGCALCQAAASILCRSVEGRPLAEIAAMQESEMLDLLGVPLRPTRRKCGLLAFKALRAMVDSIGHSCGTGSAPPAAAVHDERKPKSNRKRRRGQRSSGSPAVQSAKDSVAREESVRRRKAGSAGASPSRDPAVQRVTAPSPKLSIVLTAYNEGEEVRRTIESIRANTRPPFEIVLVDDGSTDGSCEGIEADDVWVIRHDERIGIAHSRNEGCAAATGDVFAFLDAHQRVSRECLNQCAETAVRHDAIVWPDVRGLEDRGWTGHGAFIRLCRKNGFFSAAWNRRTPRDPLSRISTLVVPGYVMPRGVYERVRWSDALRGWGASEPAITLKAFFLDIDILHLCGPLARHYFRPGRQIPYSTPWESVWRNHAVVARICFDERTWTEYWLPEVFAKHLSKAVRRELESDAVLAEHAAFQSRKVRPDREFWRGILHAEEPSCLRT